jgi:hypothetical protein
MPGSVPDDKWRIAGPYAGRDAKMIEELGIGISLHRGGRVAGHGRAQIAKTGGSDEPISASGQPADRVEALIKASFGAVDDQHGLALTHLGVFQCPERRIYRLAAPGKAAACDCQVMRKDCVDADGGNDEDWRLTKSIRRMNARKN